MAQKSDWYTCYNCAEGKIFLNAGEVWKFGKTCNGETGCYPDVFPLPNLAFQAQFYGTEQECLIEEKNKIYGYPALPECRKRKIQLIRPPGNKIHR